MSHESDAFGINFHDVKEQYNERGMSGVIAPQLKSGIQKSENKNISNISCFKASSEEKKRKAGRKKAQNDLML